MGMEEKKKATAKKNSDDSTADTAPLGSPEDGKSIAESSTPATSRPASAVPPPEESEDAPPIKSRPATAGATGTSRPTSAVSGSSNQDGTPEDANDDEIIP